MKLRVGQTLKSLVDTTGLVVVRCPDQDLSVTCGGHEMSPDAPGERVPAVGGPNGSGLQLGKRYTVDGAADVELLCVQGGEHSVAVDGTEVVQKSAKPLPASD